MERKATRRPAAPPLKAVFFDAGNTLLRPYPSVGHIYAGAAGRHGVRLTPAWIDRRFEAAWRARHRLGHPRSDTAEKKWWRALVRGVFGARFAPRAFDRFFEDLYGLFAHPRHWRLFPDARPTLRALRRKKLRLAIVSNWDSRLVTLAERLGLDREVDGLFVSAVEGCVKPDRRLFERALRHVGARSEEALHVGDSLREDYQGATGAGLSALLLQRTGRGPTGTLRVRSLAAVVTHVERVNARAAGPKPPSQKHGR